MHTHVFMRVNTQGAATGKRGSEYEQPHVFPASIIYADC